jgi:RNA polymerase primary sigma factor
MGLLKAYTKFNPKVDVKFISYSVYWIRQSILEALEKRNGINGEELPLDYEKQEENVDEDYLEADNTPNLVNEFVEDDADGEMERINKQRQALNMLFDGLTEREKNIIVRYFGLGKNKAETLEEIGNTLNLTKERVRQIKEDGMKKLRSHAVENPTVMRIYSEYVIG